MNYIEKTIAFVKQELKNAEAGHDWFHVERVYKNTLLLLQTEKADKLTALLGALLHDIADSKFHNGDETIGPNKARAFLNSIEMEPKKIDEVVHIIENVSFRGGGFENESYSKELKVVQDADRLDAIGAIGIARTFHYGGFKNNPIYDPDLPPKMNMTKEEYKANKGTTINHFYEKLLLLKDLMNTETGRKLAQQRHKYMEGFLKQFFNEWEGKC